MQWCWPSQPAIHAHDKHAQTCHGHVSVVADLCVCLHLSVHVCERPDSLCVTETGLFQAPTRRIRMCSRAWLKPRNNSNIHAWQRSSLG